MTTRKVHHCTAPEWYVNAACGRIVDSLSIAEGILTTKDADKVTCEACLNMLNPTDWKIGGAL